MSGFVGSTRTLAKSSPRPQTRDSLFIRVQVAPASSERKRPGSFAVTHAYMRFGSPGATPMPMRLRPSAAAGSPRVNGCHVVPPSIDLKSPLVLPAYALLYSQG